MRSNWRTTEGGRRSGILKMRCRAQAEGQFLAPQ